jgi:hypothetical protein
LLRYQADRLEERLLARLCRVLGDGRAARRERAAFPVTLLYGLAAGGLQLGTDPEGRGGLPGGGLLVRLEGQIVCLGEDPAACVAALAAAEEAGRRVVLDRLLGDGGAEALSRPDRAEARPSPSCGRCEGLLGGAGCPMDGACAGEACVNYGTT